MQFGGLSLMSGGLLRVLAAEPKETAKARACIILFQVGGPYQCETYDPKPNAPEEIRGLFKPARTPVPGLHFTEGLPQIARHGDKLCILRGVHHTIRCHNPAIYCSLAGREATDPMAISNRTAAKRTDHPHYASVVTKLRPGDAGMPGHVIIPNVTNNGPSKSPGLLAGYLGAQYDPFVLGADPSADDFRVESTGLPDDVPHDRFDDRQSLLGRLDAQQRSLEKSGQIETLGTFQRRAIDLLTSPKTKAAFDLAEEPAKLRDRYGRHQIGQSTLLARRLVEAGVPFVSVFSHTDVDKGSWDTHNKHVQRATKELMPPADQSFSALLEDMHERGLLKDVLVVWMGEFGRTPRMGVNVSNNTNNVGGRDHWCNCYSVALAGAGVKAGQAVGSSDAFGMYPKERPVHISDLAATIYHAMGIDPRTQLKDIQGQLRFICDGYPVEEAIG
jgi:Protein of unknown function (DUF1501)